MCNLGHSLYTYIHSQPMLSLQLVVDTTYMIPCNTSAVHKHHASASAVLQYKLHRRRNVVSASYTHSSIGLCLVHACANPNFSVVCRGPLWAGGHAHVCAHNAACVCVCVCTTGYVHSMFPSLCSMIDMNVVHAWPLPMHYIYILHEVVPHIIEYIVHGY